MILIHVICKNKQEAKKIANFLLKLKLIAGADFYQVESVYRWNNKIVNDKKIAMFLKTKKENYKKIETVFKKLSSNEVPCIFEIVLNKANRQYKDWVKQETR